MAWPPLIPVFYLVTEQGLFHRACAAIIPDLQSYPRSLLKVQMKEEMSTEFPFLDMPLLAESEWKWSFSAIAQLYTKLCDGSGMKYSPIWPCLLDSNAREQQHLYSWKTYDHHNRRNPMIVLHVFVSSGDQTRNRQNHYHLLGTMCLTACGWWKKACWLYIPRPLDSQLEKPFLVFFAISWLHHWRYLQ